MTQAPDDEDLVPVSVRLGEVVPPEDPEDWSRPLTWVAAMGMLLGPIVALGWFITDPPSQPTQAVPATYFVALALAGGAAATGATQIGAARAFAGALGAGLFGSLVVIILGVVMAGERQVGTASPTLAHAFAAAVAGLAGSADASIVAAAIARSRSRLVRFVPALASGVVLAAIVVSILMAVPPA
jgi:hypothetical protein